MQRSPVYAIKNPLARIVSVPDGLWRVQVTQSEQRGSNTSDKWQNRSHPITKNEAMVALASYNKEA